jgi:hypothetical protein
MAIRFTISGSFYPGLSASWDDPSIWDGGIVPTASDQAFVRGIRTTINFASGYTPFFDTQSIIVASTAGFPVSGTFYTYTDRDEVIKLNYITCSATQFISTSIDLDYYSWSYDIYPATQSLPSKLGGVIPNGAYVQFRPGTIYIDPSMGEIQLSSSFINPALTIENGGDVRMKSGSTLALNGYLNLQDGTFMMTGSGIFKFAKNYPSASIESVIRSINGIVATDQNLQTLILEGDESRTNTILSESVSIGDAYLSVNNAIGFAQGDDIFVGERNLTQRKTDNGFRSSYVGEISSYDEVFNVTGIDTGSNRIYFKRMNGVEGTVWATASSTELIVDEERLQVGDKVVINNQIRTITSASTYDYLLRDYDFSSGATLDDWSTDLTRSIYYADWSLSSSYGLTQFTSTDYRHIFVRDLLLDRVKVEAWISNQEGITEGSASRAEYGVYIQSEPSLDSDLTNPNSTNYPLRTAFVINPSLSRVQLRQKGYDNDILSTVYTSSYNIDGLKKITLECSNGLFSGYIDDYLVFSEFARAGVFWGRCGLYTNGNNTFVCTRYKIYAKFNKITLDSGVTVPTGSVIYETGAEYIHSPGDQVIKLTSEVIDPLEHTDYAFAYRGAPEYSGSITGSLVFPYFWGINSSGSYNSNITSYPLLLNDFNQNFDLGNGLNRSVIIDFNKQVTFNTVAFCENFITNLQNMTQSNGIQFSGSNDIIGTFPALTASNWVPLTSSVIDQRHRTNGETYRTFDTGGPHTYRFLRIVTNGITRSTTTQPNQFRGFRVRLNYSNSFQVNNSSDLEIGDRIAIISRNNITPYTNITNYSSLIFTSASATTASFLDNFNTHYTIISKSEGNVLYLRQPFDEGTIEKGSTIVKLNKSLKVSGSLDSGSGAWCVGRVAVLGSTTLRFGRRVKFENVEFQHLSGQFPSLGGNTIYSGFGLGEQNWYDWMGLVQGCSFYNNFNFSSSVSGLDWRGRSGFATRHCMLSGFSQLSLTGITPSYTAPIVSTGNVIYGITSQTNFSNNFSQNIYNYNFVFGGLNPLPDVAGYNAQYTSPYNAIYVIKRNQLEGTSGTSILSQTSLDGLGTPYQLIIENNRLSYVNRSGIVFFNAFMDKGFQTPYLLSKRGGLDARRVTPSFNASQQFSAYLTGSLVSPWHNFVGKIRNHNKSGYDLWVAQSGVWLKPNNDPYYRYYRYNLNATSNDWRNPMLGAYFYLGVGISASFDINFDYYQTPNIVWQQDQQFSGALYMIALKNGGEMQEQFVLSKTSTPTNFSKTWELTGPAFYQFALAGNATQGGYVGLANISSRLVAPASDLVQVFSNNFNLRYFGDLENTTAKTMYVQTPTDPLFRLKGARIF